MKRIKLVMVMMLFVLTVFTGCSSEESASSNDGNESGNKKIELKYWVPFSGGDGDFMKAMVAEFNKTNPDIQVEMLNLKWEEYYTKLRTAIASKQAPDVAVAHTSKLGELVPSNMIAELDPVAENAGIKWDSFNQNILNATMFEGKHMAFPLDTHAMIMFYNKKILGDAGLLNSDGKPAIEPGAEGFVKFLKQVQQKAPADVMPFVGTSNGNVPFWMWWSLYSQMDGKLLSEDGKKAAFNNKEGKEALQFISDLVHEDKLWPKNVKNGGEIFAAGKAAVNFNGVWSTGTFEKNEGLDFGATTIPQLYDQKATWGDSHTLVLPVQKEEDPKRQEAAATFANWLAENGAMWAKAGHVPSKPEVIESPEFKELEYRSDYVQVVDDVNFMPNSEKLFPIGDILRANFDLVMNGQASVDEVMNKAEKEVNDLLAK
ncbi:extracellular solute-binding protein [Aeromicrobium ponti]|uniref:Multiple sugar transport system substrate-binding protein n=1 Tax=Cytobacillus oceanisediminis TaxID=665099 RepID=A0A562J7W5_9BACI|nr:ABC transporter substrate-binding protein [Cytobacillus oceanisediminis]TWH79268.1 multiple sugar transport system substrate-binding protein [Cytobacillus oceanisediminis]